MITAAIPRFALSASCGKNDWSDQDVVCDAELGESGNSGDVVAGRGILGCLADLKALFLGVGYRVSCGPILSIYTSTCSCATSCRLGVAMIAPALKFLMALSFLIAI